MTLFLYLFAVLSPVLIVLILDGRVFSKAKVRDGVLCYKRNVYCDWELTDVDYVVGIKEKVGYRNILLEPTRYYTLVGDSEDNVIFTEAPYRCGGKSISLKEGLTYEPDSEITGLVYIMELDSGEKLQRYIEDKEKITIIENMLKNSDFEKINSKEIVCEIEIGLCHSNLPIGINAANSCEICYCEDGSWVMIPYSDIKVYQYIGDDKPTKYYGQQYQITNQQVIDVLNSFVEN